MNDTPPVLIPEELIHTLAGYEDVVKEAIFSMQLLIAATRDAQTELPDSVGFKALNNALASLARNIGNTSLEAARAVKAIYDVQSNCEIVEVDLDSAN
jgi:hypothetical protein